MPRPKLHRWSKTIGRWWDRQRLRLRLGRRKPVIPVSYRGYGRADRVCLSGRVLRDKAIIRRDSDTFWRNFINNVKRFNSREINDAHLSVALEGQQFELLSDAEGYFHLDQSLSRPLTLSTTSTSWHTAEVTVQSIPGQQIQPVSCPAEIIIPQGADFGIISDIDDTVIKTDVTGLLKLRTLYLTLLKNAGTRIAFRTVKAFYRALQRGPSGEGYNPFFYVSNSPWNLYDLLEEFLDLNELPRGPILLRDFGLPYQDLPPDHRGHKHEQIVEIIRLYPEMRFVLIGDSAEKDTDIYLAIAREFPGRILAIYIRDVLHLRRAQRVQRLLAQTDGTPVLLCRNYGQAARHAAKLGLVQNAIFDQIEAKQKPLHFR